MYTLDLRELKLTPPIREEKRFENEESFKLEEEAAAYVAATYGDTYNPVTVERLVKKAVRDARGKTQNERFDEQDETLNEAMMATRAERQVRADAVRTEFAPKNVDLRTWLNTESDKVLREYDEKIAAASPEGKEQLKSEQQLKLDDIKFEFRKKSDALWDEQSAKEQAVWREE